MSAKLNRNDILSSLLRALVDGWGYGAVREALIAFEDGVRTDRKPKPRGKSDAQRDFAVAQVEELHLPSERRELLLTLAVRYEEGSAFPKLGDARAFLLSHQRNAKDINSRAQAFRRMLPILSQMSEKGLETVIARSHHSGPAELAPISQAIRGAGEVMRGRPEPSTSGYGRETLAEVHNHTYYATKETPEDRASERQDAVLEPFDKGEHRVGPTESGARGRRTRRPKP